MSFTVAYVGEGDRRHVNRGQQYVEMVRMAQWSRKGAVGAARRKKSGSHANERPLITLPRARDTYAVFDAHGFRNALNVLIARGRDPFTVLVMRPALPGTTLRLADIVLEELRTGSGDLAGYLEGAVAVMLRGTGREGALQFRDRVREAWGHIGGGELFTEIAEYPTEEERTIELLTADWSGGTWMPVVIDDGASPDQPAHSEETNGSAKGMVDR